VAHVPRDLVQFTAEVGDLSIQIGDLVAQFPAGLIEKPARIPASHQGNDRNHRENSQKPADQYNDQYNKALHLSNPSA
jgi:hypothetical protein